MLSLRGQGGPPTRANPVDSTPAYVPTSLREEHAPNSVRYRAGGTSSSSDAQQQGQRYRSEDQAYDADVESHLRGNNAMTQPTSTLDIETRYREFEQTHAWVEAVRWAHMTRYERMMKRFYARAGLVTTVFLALVVLAADVTVVWLIVEFALPQSFVDNAEMYRLFNMIDFAVSFIYVKWMYDIVQRFSEPHAHFLKLLELILHGYERLHETVFGLESDESTSVVVREYAAQFHRLFMALTFYSYRLFVRADDSDEASLVDYVPPDTAESRQLARYVDRDANAFSVFNTLMMLVERRVTEIEDQVSTSDVNRLTNDRYLERLCDAVSELRVAARIHVPYVFIAHIRALLIISFLVIEPLTLSARFGPATIALYPVPAFMLVGFYAYKVFLGNPFTALHEFTGMPTDQWRSEYLQRIERRYSTWLGTNIDDDAPTPTGTSHFAHHAMSRDTVRINRRAAPHSAHADYEDHVASAIASGASSRAGLR